ncbi:hypothetical protein A3C26_04605 [Candidatus Daviesbacteria bacterium RIFCSPHIGHO2_02_FULL_39_12]|uniref:Uncharacterized protein n=1 Tax=Candidatus Daviesbacteria bacterium RIFCSPHIGHO2_02_FULL_39_12 TaxID=1797770 RepID=A0A1F5JDB5_9BACT|nr:MAG: hypothetical protein A3C26_04605 [Candidatus Daviesbacteria bacterium RIFCSPHIGHO2_02_FULL_39_12]
MLGNWHPKIDERRGLHGLAAQGHKVIILSGLYFELGSSLRYKLEQTSDWQILTGTDPKTLPPAILRAGRINKAGLPANARVGGVVTRSNHLGMGMIYPL